MKKILVALLLILCLSPLFSNEVMIEWQWDLLDEEISFFRYQIDGETEEDWTVVDSTITSFNLGPVDSQNIYSLYLQQSYDGENWSESAVVGYNVSVIEVAKEPEQEPIVEVAEELTPFIHFEEPIEEPSVIEEAPVVFTALDKDEKNRKIEILIGFAGKGDNKFFKDFFTAKDDFVSLKTFVFPSVTLDYIDSTLFSVKKNLNLGLKVGLFYNLYDRGNKSIFGAGLHLLPVLEYKQSPKLSFNGALGLTGMLTMSDIHSDNSNTAMGFFYGSLVQAGMNYNLGERWTLALQGEAKLLMANNFKPYELLGSVRMGMGYRF